MTGPYHIICSLKEVLKNHKEFKEAVLINKKKLMKYLMRTIISLSPYIAFDFYLSGDSTGCGWINSYIGISSKFKKYYDSKRFDQRFSRLRIQ